MDLSRLTAGEKLIAASGLVLFLASLLPWYRLDLGVLGRIDRNGWDVGIVWSAAPALLGLAAGGVVLATRLGTAPWPEPSIGWGRAHLAAGALSVVLVVPKLLLGHEEKGVPFDRALGLFLAVGAALGFALGGALRYQEQRSGRSPAAPRA